MTCNICEKDDGKKSYMFQKNIELWLCEKCYYIAQYYKDIECKNQAIALAIFKETVLTNLDVQYSEPNKVLAKRLYL